MLRARQVGWSCACEAKERVVENVPLKMNGE